MEQTLLIILIGLVAILCIAVAMLIAKVGRATLEKPLEKSSEKVAAPVNNIAVPAENTRIKAAIVAAISAYYASSPESAATEFVVRRIRRIG